MTASDAARVELAIDAARVVDDFVRGVIALGAGELDGGEPGGGHPDRRRAGRRWSRPLLAVARLFGERQLVQVMGAAFAPEQLRKAAREADALVVAVDALLDARREPAVHAAEVVLTDGVREIPAILRRPDLGARSPELIDVHRRLTRWIGVLHEARTKLVLADMRGEPPTGS